MPIQYLLSTEQVFIKCKRQGLPMVILWLNYG